MSIFSKIKSAKKVAEEHKAQQAAKEAAESSKPAPEPYHHVPKHAAQDALAGTPGTADKQAIRDANKQRSLYARDTFWSSSAPSLSRNGSEAGSIRGMPIGGEGSRSSSRARRPPLQDRRSHPGYASYQNLSLSTQDRATRSRANSRYGKSPLSSVPITPRDSSAASSASAASSFSSNRSYTDPITPSAPFSERLETISSNRSVRSVQAAGRSTLYTPRVDADKPKPWELAAAKKAKAKAQDVQVEAKEITKPEPVAKRGRFMSIGRKQQAVAAC